MTTTHPFPSTPYTPTHKTWPYTPSDFTRADPSPDSNFYAQPRLVTHIDPAAVARLTRYYASSLPRRGKLLDLCTSWVSFYPDAVHEAVESGDAAVYGVGLNAVEMSLNPIFRPGRWGVVDLNTEPFDAFAAFTIGDGEAFDAFTCAVSIDYLTCPLRVLGRLLDVAAPGAGLHVAVSNRCFPTKAVRRWGMLGERARLEFVGDILWFSGWRGVEVVDLCAEGGDPLWVVRGRKEGVVGVD